MASNPDVVHLPMSLHYVGHCLPFDAPSRLRGLYVLGHREVQIVEGLEGKTLRNCGFGTGVDY